MIIDAIITEWILNKKHEINDKCEHFLHHTPSQIIGFFDFILLP